MNNNTPKSCLNCGLFSDSSAFCAHLTPLELADINRDSRTSAMKRGDSLGDATLMKWPIIAVSSGVLSLQFILSDGRKSIAALFMHGDIVDLRGSAPHNRGHLVALKKTEVCKLAPGVFTRVLEENPDAMRLAWSKLREQSLRANAHSADLSNKRASERLASFIFECSNREVRRGDASIVNIPVRRMDLADYLGMQPETLSRSFRDLEGRNIISLKKLSVVEICDIPALRRIANGDRPGPGFNPRTRPRVKILGMG